MLYVLVFSFSVVSFSITHQIVWVVFLGGILLALFLFSLFTKRNILLSFIMMALGVLSVVLYDLRMVGSFDELLSMYQGFIKTQYLHPDAQLLVQERSKNGRYVVTEYVSLNKDTTQKEKQLVFLLYSKKILHPGDLVVTTTKPIWSKGICGQCGQQKDSSTLIPSEPKENSFDYDRWLYMQGIDGSLYDDNVAIVGQTKLGTITNIKEYFYKKIKDKYGNNETIAGLIAGMTIGDTSLISKDWYQQFIDSGLVHLIAVSGGNIAIVVMFIGFLLFWLPFYLRYFCLLIAIVCYAMMVGDDSSMVRAAVMGVLTILALFPGRQISIWRSMTYAWIIMLLYNPYYLVYDLGFGLSFAAIVGMVELSEWWENKKNQNGGVIQSIEMYKKNKNLSYFQYCRLYFYVLWTYCLENYMLPTFGATLGVTPLLLRSMEQTNIAAPLLNIFVVPLVPIVTIAGFLLPFVYIWTRFDNILTVLLHWVFFLSAIGREYGLYLSMSHVVKNIFLLSCLVWWLRYRTTKWNEKSQHIA